MAATVKSLDERMDDFERSFEEFKNRTIEYEKTMADFRGRVDVVISMLRWAGGAVVSVAVVLIFQTVSISNSAGKIEGKIEAQGQQVLKLESRIDAQSQQIQKLTELVRQDHDELVRLRVEFAQARQELTEIKSLLKERAKP